MLTVEDLHIVTSATAVIARALDAPVNSMIRHNFLAGAGGINRQCPSLIEGNINVGGGGGGGSNCVLVNNIGLF